MATADLAQVLADAREEATILRAHGHAVQAKSIEALADKVSASMARWLVTLSEGEAMLRSGWTASRLRSRFAEWEAAGFAMLDARGKRRYRECIVPVRSERASDRLAGERGESLRHG